MSDELADVLEQVLEQYRDAFEALKAQEGTMEKDLCARCGCDAEGDSRKLWMSCFYRMSELDVPLTLERLVGELHDQIGTKVSGTFTLPVFSPEGTKADVQFYTMRVCKGCRGQWMAAISKWFNEVAQDDPRDAVGTARELSDDEACKLFGWGTK